MEKEYSLGEALEAYVDLLESANKEEYLEICHMTAEIRKELEENNKEPNKESNNDR